MNIIMAGSATGGHIYPAIAIADKIKRKIPSANILFVGAKKELGSNIVTDNNYRIEYINARGFNRKNLLKNISVVKDLLKSKSQIKKIFKTFKPDLVIGTGGYVSGPVIREAKKQGIKTVLHEQNVLPGMSNKLSEKYTDKIFVGFEEGKKHFKEQDKIVVTGNPVRKGFITAGIIDYREKMNIKDKDFVLLIFGGSRGADRINEVTQELLFRLNDRTDMVVYFITGRNQYWDIMEDMNKKGITKNENFHIIEYTEAIHEYFAVADIVISRSGALTVSEITVCGKPSILVPSPNVTGNHQYFNAKPLADNKAAIIIDESELTADKLLEEIVMLKNNKERLNSMADASSKLGKPDAVDMIFDNLELLT